METDKKLFIALGMIFIVYMLFMYNQVNCMKDSIKKENETLLKRVKGTEDINNAIQGELLKISSVPTAATDNCD